MTRDEMMPKSLGPRAVAMVFASFAVIVTLATYFVDCDEAPCNGQRVTGYNVGRYTSLCVENRP